MNIQTPMPTPDFVAIKGRQKMMWGAGDYARIGVTLQIVGEMLCEAVDLRSNERALDVAAGNGNATIAAARRFADVVSTDYVPALLERGRARAEADGLDIVFQEADAEALPFADESFDVVMSTFGVMFAPNQPQVARELLRVCRKGGRIGLASWTPGSFIGQLFKTIGAYIPPAPGLQSPALWGDVAHLEKLFGPNAAIASQMRTFNFRYKSPAHFVDMFRNWYGPVAKAFEALDAERAGALEADVLALIDACKRGGDGGLAIPGEYLEAVITKGA